MESMLQVKEGQAHRMDKLQLDVIAIKLRGE